MGAINESARKIVDIIAVIDGIAFQTNILALNAAVAESAAEAMREQAESLTQLVSVFKLSSMQGPVTTTSSVPFAKPKGNAISPRQTTSAAAQTPSDPLRVKRLANVGNSGDWTEF